MRRIRSTVAHHCKWALLIVSCHRDTTGLFRVRRGGKWGYADRSGAMVIRPQFDSAAPFSEGLARVSGGRVVNYIDENGKVVPSASSFTSVWEFKCGLAQTFDGKFGFINKSGQEVIPSQLFPEQKTEPVSAVSRR
jgi:hypothetical protein